MAMSSPRGGSKLRGGRSWVEKLVEKQLSAEVGHLKWYWRGGVSARDARYADIGLLGGLA